MPAAAPNSFSVNRIFVLFNWQNFNSCKFFSVFLMKTGAAKFWICISIDFYSTEKNLQELKFCQLKSTKIRFTEKLFGAAAGTAPAWINRGIIQMICARSAEREYPSGQRAGERVGKHWFDSEGCYAIFFPFSAAISVRSGLSDR